MFKFDKKPEQHIPHLEKNESQQMRGGSQYDAMRQMSSLVGNQAMLAMMRTSGQSHQSQTNETPFTGQMRERFGLPIKPVEQSKSPDQTLTGGVSLPDYLREKFEKKSGLPMDDVRVHYNSDQPEQLDALAYTYGADVYIGPGQEEHLEHELGHVVQQKQGIVSPTAIEYGIPINDDPSLEKNTVVLGKKRPAGKTSSVVQKAKIKVNADIKSRIKKIGKSKGPLRNNRRNTTSFNYLTKRRNQGPHIIPVIMRAVLLDALEDAKFPIDKLVKTRLILSPAAAERNLTALIQLSKYKNKVLRNAVKLHIAKYKKHYDELVRTSSAQKKVELLAQLMDLSPFQTYCIGRMPTKEEIGGKGETRGAAAKDLLSKSSSTIDYGKKTNKKLKYKLEYKTTKTLAQIKKIASSEKGTDLDLSEDSEE